MALIVETGAGVPGANSYDTIENVTAFAASRGVALDADKVEAQILNAMDYLAMFGAKWGGRPTYINQDLAFPRYGIYYDRAVLDSATIPKQLKQALALLVIAQHSGVEIFGSNSTEAFVTKEKVDVIETTYSEAVRVAQIQAGDFLPRLPLVAALLNPLMDGGAFTLRTRRV